MTLPRDSIVQIASYLGASVADVLAWADVNKRHRQTIFGETSDVDAAALWRSVLAASFGSDAIIGKTSHFKQRALFLTNKRFTIGKITATLAQHVQAVVADVAAPAATWPVDVSKKLTGLLVHNGCDLLLSVLVRCARAIDASALNLLIEHSSDPRVKEQAFPQKYSLVRVCALMQMPASMAAVAPFADKSVLTRKAGWCRCPLQEAVAYLKDGDLRCIKLLLKQLAVPGWWAWDSCVAYDEDGSNLMHLAVRTGRADLVALLCHAPDYPAVLDTEGDPEGVAELNGLYRHALVEAVVRGVEHGRTPLAVACTLGHLDVVRELLACFRGWEQEGRLTVREAVGVVLHEYYQRQLPDFCALDDARQTHRTKQTADTAEIVRLLEAASQ